MGSHLDLAREILIGLLSDGPQRGAWLREQLAREFERRSGVRFDVVDSQFPKFSAFLAANGDVVEVLTPGGPGDVTVRLRTTGNQVAVSPRPADSSLSRIPTDLWQAFTNPDPRRRRFYNRVTRHVKHFLEGAPTALDETISREVSLDLNYVEIDYVPASTQNSWMREFLQSAPLPERQRNLCNKIITMPYESSVNTLFIAALAGYGGAWIHFRAAKVQEVVRTWAHRHGFSLNAVAATTYAVKEHSENTTRKPFAGTTAPPSADRTQSMASSDKRKRLHVLVDCLEDTELDQILLPASLLLKISALERRV